MMDTPSVSRGWGCVRAKWEGVVVGGPRARQADAVPARPGFSSAGGPVVSSPVPRLRLDLAGGVVVRGFVHRPS